MTWTYESQSIPLLSRLLAFVPIVFLFWALAWKKMKGHWAALLTLFLSCLVAVFFFKMPFFLALLSIVYGILFGIWPICGIVVATMFLYNLSVKSGQFEVIKHSLSFFTSDRRIQAILIAFSLGAFLEGTTGFGTPVAIASAILTGLGFEPLLAATVCLIANTAPVPYASAGIPVIVASQVSGIDTIVLSKVVGQTLFLMSLLLPFYIAIIISGFRRSLEVWPACLVSGASFAIFFYATAHFLGPMLPSIVAGIFSAACLILFLKLWHPKQIFLFPQETNENKPLSYSQAEIKKAWLPFLLLSLLVGAWSFHAFQNFLNQYSIVLPIAGLHKQIMQDKQILPAIFTFNILSMPGTAIFLATLISLFSMRISTVDAFATLGQTIRNLRYPIFTITNMLGFAYLLNFSGMATSMGKTFAETGMLFPIFSAFLGWLGVFMTGSNTCSNALFGKLQEVTASNIGVESSILVSGNVCGGVCGKMVSPQSLSIATAATNQLGQESQIFRATWKHSLLFAFFIAVIVFLQALLSRRSF